MQKLDKPEFTKNIVYYNSPALKFFKKWIFYPGMLFDSLDKWWGHGLREKPHEGLDLCYYKDKNDRICQLDEKTKIPVIFDGMIAGIIDDFLGKSIIIEHKTAEQTFSFCTIFGHVIPENSIVPGCNVKKGEVIATLADAGKSKSKILPHLHITMGHLSEGVSHSVLSWNNISNPEIFIMQDPILMIGKVYQVLNNR
jgi:hypothetical protein